LYAALIVVLIGLAVAIGGWGFQKKRFGLFGLGVGIALVTAAFFGFLSFWSEYLWFDALGYADRFWIRIGAQAAVMVTGAAVGALIVWALTLPFRAAPAWTRLAPAVVAVLAGLGWGSTHWSTALRFVNRVQTGVTDPVFGQDTGFYLFGLPMYDAVYALLLMAVLLSVAGWGLALLAGAGRDLADESQAGQAIVRYLSSREGPAHLRALALPLGALALLLAWGRWLQSYHLMYSEWGAVFGAGWTDVHVRLPGYYVTALAAIALGVLLLVPQARRSLLERPFRQHGSVQTLLGMASGWAVLIAVWVLALGAAPALVQWLRVEPNEITLERPYIENNIEMTRRAFGVHEIKEREYPATEELEQADVQDNEDLLSEVRLWDWRALDAVYKQFQEIRLYYEFVDVDIDRYHVNGDYREVMVSAREMEPSNLPESSQTFVNRRFKYTHGYGLTMAPVNEFTEQGLPRLLVRDIPPQSTHASLEVTDPQIYYGELTDEHVYVNTSEPEFDYPKGEQNAYTRYSGKGGVEIGSLWRKFLFGWRFDGTRFFLSGYPQEGSRVLFRREIRERVDRLVPFLELDDDPYVVLHDGRLHWILDAYTTSDRYPYSEPYDSYESIEIQSGQNPLERRTVPRFDGENYVRNAVKVVVDAYDGTVDFYVFEDQDPLIRVWQRIFPDLFQPRSAMPEGLERHVRYPADLLLAQGLVYAKYHMTDPAVFYNQEDLWVRATEKYYAGVQPVSPYYVMWRPPESKSAEFTLILPFTPKNRQVMIGWIAGLCDGENYGKFLAYKFPKERRILGPQQVETKIDQDRFLSGQLSLWDQRGSRVIRGNVLAIPIAETVMYVEPIYLQAETAAYPELRLVVVMHGDEISYAHSFDEALAGLFEEGEGPAAAPAAGTEPGAPAGAAAGTARQAVRDAQSAFDDYRRAIGDGRFRDAADALERLQRSLQRLEGQLAPQDGERGPGETPGAAGEL
jgi:hypothetical protein